MGLGNVVNVNALLTGNATSLVGAANLGKKSMGELAASYKAASGAAVASASETQAAMAKSVAAAQAAATAAKSAASQATAARQLAAAQAEVASQREIAAQAKSVAAAQAAAQAKARADVIQTQSMQANAAAQAAAAERAAAAATLASAQKVSANAKAMKAADVEAAAINKALASEEAALAASARAAQLAAAQKQEAFATSSAAWGKAAMVIGAGAAIVGVGAVAMAADFEKSTQRLHTSGGVAMEDVAKMREGILQIAQSVGIGASELADGMYDVVSGGYAGADALNILKAAAQGAKAEGADMSVMAKGLTAVMASYNIPATEAVTTTNALSAASGLAKGSLQEFTGSLATVLPVASTLGISFAEVSAAVAVMTQKGKSADQATQELRNALLNLSKPNEVAAKMMQQLGISADDLSSNLSERGLGGTLNYLTEKILSSSEDGRVLLGTFKESAQAGEAMNTMLGTMSPQLATWSQELMNGKITSQEYTNAVNTLDINQEALGDQFLKLAKKSAGFSDTIKKGGPETVNYTSALATMMGGTTGLQAALDLTGASADNFAAATKTVSDAQKIAGENVATNASTQSTVAAAWDRLSATVGVLAIQLGQTLLPAAQNIITVFSDTIKFFQENKSAAEGLGLAVAAIAGGIVAASVAMKAYAAVQVIAALATGGFTAAMTAANGAMFANPIGLIILAIAALVAGVIWAYNNIGWFKDGVDAAFKWIGEVVAGFVSWLNTDFVPFMIDAWTNIVNAWNGAIQIIVDAFNWVVTTATDIWTTITDIWNTGVTAIADACTWLYETIIKPVWDAIVEAMKIGVTIIGTVVVAPMVIAMNLIGAAATWLYENAIKPAWDGIMWAVGIVWSWLKVNVFDPWGLVFEAAGAVVAVWWNGVVQGWNDLMNGIAVVWKWVEDNIFKPWQIAFEYAGIIVATWWAGVVKGWNDLLAGIAAVWQWVEANIFAPWQLAFEVAGAVVAVWWAGVVQGWNDLMAGIAEVWRWLETNVFKPWNDTADGMGKAFQEASKIVEGAWKVIQDAAREPIRFLIEEVYTKGIQATWNGIADSVGLSWRLGDIGMPFANGGVVPGFANGGIPAFHGGGIMSGYSPGIDDRLIAVGGGEAVMRPEWTKMVGPNGVAAMNSAARANDGRGVRAAMSAIGSTGGAFADGGIVGDVIGNIGSFLSDVGTNAMNLIGGVASFLSNPLGGVIDAVGGVVSGLLAGIPGKGGGFVNAVSEIPPKIVQGIADKAVQLVQTLMASMASAGGTPGTWDGSGGVLAFPAPGASLSQGFSGINGHNGVDLANAMGSPVISAEAGVVTQAGWSAFGGGNEVHIHHPSGLETWYAHLNGFAVGNGQQVGRAQLVGPMGMTGNATGPHVHFMVMNGGWPAVMDPMGFFNQGGIVNSGVFDTGGTLAPGWNMVNNQTGGPEHLSRTDDDFVDKLVAGIARALEGATFRVDGSGTTAKLVLAARKRAGVSR